METVKCRWCHTPIIELPDGSYVHAYSGSAWCGNFTHKAEQETT